ncbi:MAG: sigma-54 dependent transcriptional regulator [Burkholderiaceae bacterium]|jgi:two-component system response regulator PilR (NtrC family)|nr:sigma-54 dependent transcriptional regulator [Burkholderiaceae bacterium]
MSTHSPAAGAACVLVVDDEPDLRTLYELTMLREGHQVHTAGSLAEAREQLAARGFDAVITDMRLPDGLGLELLRAVSAEQRRERCIVITAYGSAENAVEALKSGAFDYLSKPVDLKQFRSVVRSAAQAPPADQTGAAAPSSPLISTNQGHRRQGAADALQKIIGDSSAMRAVKQRLVKVAQSMAPVLVHGESGTGKELVAKAIHACSHRGAGPFVPVNCGAITETLLEAEFFGARKGAYTGAAQDREGFFQAASGGTLFLDEIGDLPMAMQAKLLRAIQERRIRPLGDAHEEAVDVRIVSATHKDLAAEIQAGRFRQDLFYRLNVIEIVVPPLRERREDLPALCQALLERIAADVGAPVYRLSARQWREIVGAPLTGNVRELENLLHRAVALGEGSDADEPDTGARLPDPASGGADDDAALPADLKAWLAGQEKQILIRALEQTGFNRTAAAAKLGLNLRQIRYRMAQLSISSPSADADEDDESAVA